MCNAYIGCVERTGVLGAGGGVMVAHGSSGLVALTWHTQPSVYHMFFLIMQLVKVSTIECY